MLSLGNLAGKIKNKCQQWRETFAGKKEHSDIVRTKQRTNLGAVVLVVLVGIFAFCQFLLRDQENRENELNEIDDSSVKKYQDFELATDAVSGDVKWRNHLEDAIETEGTQRQEQIQILKNVVEQNHQAMKTEQSKEFEELKSRLSFALEELTRLRQDQMQLQQDSADRASNRLDHDQDEMVSMHSIIDEAEKMMPVSSFNYIPATSFVSGFLLGGIAVSTSVNSASEPIPVVIKITDHGNLPPEFIVDMKQCRLLASCYGDISSERAMIRAEELVCEDRDNGTVISTKVAGVIYGDDGANGIRGEVVSMSEKHLKNAFLGGVLSGFASNAKGQRGVDITALGVSQKKLSAQDMASDGFLQGSSSAAERLANYHIKLAENIAPVILIPGGTKVDIVFTHGVEVGALDTNDQIRRQRKTTENSKNQNESY